MHQLPRVTVDPSGPMLCDEITFRCKFDETCEPLQQQLYNVACQDEILDPTICSARCKSVALILLQHPAMNGFVFNCSFVAVETFYQIGNRLFK